MKKQKTHSKNCQSCGKEVLSYQIRPIKFGSMVYDSCPSCVELSGVYKDYESAIGMIRLAENEQNEQNIKSPNVIIDPIEPAIDAAVKLLKMMNPNYFVGISKIVVGMSGQFGHVESGPDKDPTILNINMSRIKSALKNSNDKAELIASVAMTIAHEAAHTKSYNSQHGFVGGEAVAEAEEEKVYNWIEANRHRLVSLGL